MECKFIKASNGAFCLFHNKRLHYRNHQWKNRTIWHCSNLECKAKVTTIGEKILFAERHSCLEYNLMSTVLNGPCSFPVAEDKIIKKIGTEVVSLSDNQCLPSNDAYNELSENKTDTKSLNIFSEYDEDPLTNNNTISEEHFYDLDENQSLEDTPNVHITDIPDVHVTDGSDFPFNLNSGDFETLSQLKRARPFENGCSFVDNINSVELETTVSEKSDPLYIPPYIPPYIYVVPAKTFQSTKPISIIEHEPKIKVCKDFFETVPEPNIKKGTNPLSSQRNLITFDTPTFVPIGSTFTVSQSFLNTTGLKAPLMVMNNNASPNHLMPSTSIRALTKTSSMSFPAKPNPLAYSTGLSNINKVSSNIGASSPTISVGLSNIGDGPSNIGSGPLLTTRGGPSNIDFLSSISPQNHTTTNNSKSDECLNLSKDYIYKKMKMEQTQFDYKMENLTKERQCLKERHDVEMKVLQLKLKYVTAQYEEMLKRKSKKSDKLKSY